MTKKYILYSAITIGLIIISYVIYNLFNEKYNYPIEIHIYSFNNLEAFSDNELTEIKSYFNDKYLSHVIYLHTPKNKNDKEVMIIKPSGLKSNKEYEKNYIQTIDSLSKLIYLFPTISRNEANYLMNHLISNINKGTHKNKRVFIIRGNFPINYTNKDINEINIDDKLKKNKSKDRNIEINWVLKSNSSEPEQIYFDLIKKAGYYIKNKIETTELRASSTHLFKPIYIIMMNPISSNDIFDLTNYIRLYYGSALKITIWNNSKYNKFSFTINDENIKGNDSLKVLENLNTVQWDDFGKLINDATSDITSHNFNYKVPLIFLGNMPKVGSSIQLNEKTWETLKDTKNIDIICYITKGKVLNETDLLFREGLKISNIHYIER
mgnify:CR=1 FL=1